MRARIWQRPIMARHWALPLTVLAPLVGAVFLAGCGGSLNNGNLGLTSDDVSGGGGAKAAFAGRTKKTAHLGEFKTRTSGSKKIFKTASGELTAYVIGPHDVLNINVFGVKELSGNMTVTNQGTIDYPLLGSVKAAGQTTIEIQDELTKKLGAKYLQKPKVAVMVKAYNSQRFTLTGAIKKPGVYNIAGKTSLVQAIAMAGGLDKVSDSSNIVVIRKIGDKRHAARFDYASLQTGRANDPEIKRGDMIVVGKSQIRAMLGDIGTVLPITSVFMALL